MPVLRQPVPPERRREHWWSLGGPRPLQPRVRRCTSKSQQGGTIARQRPGKGDGVGAASPSGPCELASLASRTLLSRRPQGVGKLGVSTSESFHALAQLLGDVDKDRRRRGSGRGRCRCGCGCGRCRRNQCRLLHCVS